MLSIPFEIRRRTNIGDTAPRSCPEGPNRDAQCHRSSRANALGNAHTTIRSVRSVRLVHSTQWASFRSPPDRYVNTFHSGSLSEATSPGGIGRREEKKGEFWRVGRKRRRNQPIFPALPNAHSPGFIARESARTPRIIHLHARQPRAGFSSPGATTDNQSPSRAGPRPGRPVCRPPVPVPCWRRRQSDCGRSSSRRC